MGMFAMRKPRGFNHSYIYVDERKEKLAKMEGSEMAGFQFAGAELDMTESTVGDAFVGILHVFLCPFTEVKVSDSFFRIQPFFQ